MINQKHDNVNFIMIFSFLGFWLSSFLVANFTTRIFIDYFIDLNIFNIFAIYEVHNTGAAFNILSNSLDFLIIASFVALTALTLIIIVNSSGMSIFSVFAAGLLSGGITSNLLERINYGYVKDYFYLKLIPEMPVFNSADVMIVVGTAILIFSILKKKERRL